MSLISAIIGSDQTSKAVSSLVNADTSAMNIGNTATTAAQNQVMGAGKNANDVLSGVLQAQTSNLQPYLSLGSTAATNLSAALAPGGGLTNTFSFDPTQIAGNPDYQFQLQQGIKAVQGAAAATGTNLSSGTLKGLTNYAGGLASNEIGQAYNQALTTFNTNRQNTLQNYLLPLQAGQTASGQANTALAQYAPQVNSNIIGTNQLAAQYGLSNSLNQQQLTLNTGNAKAGGSIRQGDIWGGVAGSMLGGGNGLSNAVYNATPNFGTIGNAAASAALGLG